MFGAVGIKNTKPGTTERSGFGAEDVSEMELVETVPILRWCKPFLFKFQAKGKNNKENNSRKYFS